MEPDTENPTVIPSKNELLLEKIRNSLQNQWWNGFYVGALTSVASMSMLGLVATTLFILKNPHTK